MGGFDGFIEILRGVEKSLGKDKASLVFFRYDGEKREWTVKFRESEDAKEKKHS